MTARDAGVILALFLSALIAGDHLLRETVRGRALVAWILVRTLGDRRHAPRYEGNCCVAARAGRSDAGYYLHRVREHGEGAA
jgi:hypothetical protein